MCDIIILSSKERRDKMKGYILISKYRQYEMWEHKKFGDIVPAVVIKEGKVIGSTFDNIIEFVKIYEEE